MVQDKRQWYGLHGPVLAVYAAPGLNPFEQGVVGEEGGERQPRLRYGAGAERNEHLFDSTLATSAERLANRMVSEGFPDGVNWATLKPGPFLRPGTNPQEPQQPTDEDRDAIDLTEDRIFEALHSANAGLALLQMVFDGVVSGTGLMKVGTARDSDTLLEFEAVNQAEVALEARNAMAKVRGRLPQDVVADAGGHRGALAGRDRICPRTTRSARGRAGLGDTDMHDATYYDSPDGALVLRRLRADRWRATGTAHDGSTSQDYHVSPWVDLAVQAAHRARCRDGVPVMSALPEARDVEPRQADPAGERESVRSLGMYTYKVTSTGSSIRARSGW